jgi:hypothetical protein
MKAIPGGKAKNDKIDAHKMAVLLRGGMVPQAYVYPALDDFVGITPPIGRWTARSSYCQSHLRRYRGLGNRR